MAKPPTLPDSVEMLRKHTAEQKTELDALALNLEMRLGVAYAAHARGDSASAQKALTEAADLERDVTGDCPFMGCIMADLGYDDEDAAEDDATEPPLAAPVSIAPAPARITIDLTLEEAQDRWAIAVLDAWVAMQKLRAHRTGSDIEGWWCTLLRHGENIVLSSGAPTPAGARVKAARALVDFKPSLADSIGACP